MKIVVHPTPERFVARAGSWLDRAPAEHDLFFTICASLVANPERVAGPVYLLTVEEAGMVVTAALETPGRKWVVSRSSLAAVRALVDFLRARDWPVPGILGPAEIARVFAERWCAAARGAARPGRAQRIYELRQLVPPTPVPGQARLAEPAEAETVTAWGRAFALDLRADETPEETEEAARWALADGRLHLWEDGAPVAMTIVRTARRRAGISAVYTPPERRRRGYATALVAAVSARMLTAGAELCFLFTDLANPTSNNIYQRIGFRPVADWADYFFD